MRKNALMVSAFGTDMGNGEEWEVRGFLDMNLARSSNAESSPSKDDGWTGYVCATLARY